MKKKTAILLALSLALVASLTILSVVGASNEEISSNEPNSVITSDNELGSASNPIKDLTSFLNTLGEWSETATSTDKKATTSFTVPKDYGHVEAYFLNQGTGTVTITITHMQSGLVYLTESVGAGKATTWRSTKFYLQGLRSGDYSIQYRSSSVSNVKVYTSGFASNNAAKVDTTYN
ncbi:hypothetical protein [Paenibacillus gallinarum]|uniref:Uncharacterized protein n=1 Tax=Paenibacillus gallinarum TaxID=2762232 RepID=A0ABR8SUH4_9BACL|nr:hypothetical protein [Paenibacillus gallinarum]MBD7967156.1 hypothetical protein [Paenibacillus gallinarum]